MRITCQPKDAQQVRNDARRLSSCPTRGRLTESAAGAHLANAAAAGECEVFYWRERNREVDLVVKTGRRLMAFEKNNLLSWSGRSAALCITSAGPTTRPEDQHG
jgi:hypothetical protein